MIGKGTHLHPGYIILRGIRIGDLELITFLDGSYRDKVYRTVFIKTIDTEFHLSCIELLLPYIVHVGFTADSLAGFPEAGLLQPERDRLLPLMTHHGYHNRHVYGKVLIPACQDVSLIIRQKTQHKIIVDR